MKLEVVNSRVSSPIEEFPPKEVSLVVHCLLYNILLV